MPVYECFKNYHASSRVQADTLAYRGFEAFLPEHQRRAYGTFFVHADAAAGNIDFMVPVTCNQVPRLETAGRVLEKLETVAGLPFSQHFPAVFPVKDGNNFTILVEPDLEKFVFERESRCFQPGTACGERAQV